MDLQLKRRRHARLWFNRYRKRFYPAMKKIPLEVGAGNLRCHCWGETVYEGEEPILVRIAEAAWTKGSTSNHSFLKSIIIHELIHAALGPKYDHDSEEWRKEVLRLSKEGALLETI